MPVRLFNIIAWVILVVPCTACATAGLAEPEQDLVARQFEMPAGVSNIYIYRNQDIVFNNEMPVDIDGKPAGDTNQGTFI
jgi:hypothetical protein